MGKFVAQRLLALVPVLLLVTFGVFSMQHLSGVDPVVLMLGEVHDPEAEAALRHELGLDQPLLAQYANWLGRVMRGDFGRSFKANRPVIESLRQRIPVTLELAFLSIALSLVIAVPAGIVSAVKRNSLADLVSSSVAFLGISMPHFWLGILLILLFSLTLRWLPPSGYFDPTRDPLGNLRLMVLPAITVGSGLAAIVMRMVRSSMLEVLSQEYIRTARAKGLTERRVVWQHALRNALIPVVTVVGLQIGRLMGGTVIAETIFSVPGVGQLAVSAIFQRDYPVVRGVVLFMVLAVVFTNLVVDLAYGFLDPRIRYT